MKKTKFSHKVMAVFLTLTFLPSLLPVNFLFASNNGPNAPEAASFEPVDATDMVNLVSGDVSYVLPLLDMDGFPLTLSYHAGIPLDMESSWTGLGWNVNAGAISRSVSGTPDDWNDGKSLDFIHFEDSEEFYNVNVGVGISQAAEVGVGISWGSNKSLSGSVYGTFMMVNASIATDGAYSAGIGLGAGNGNFGGVLSAGVSGNVNGGASYGSANLGLGGSTSSGARGSLGFSLTDGSVNLSGGFSNKTAYDKGQAGGSSLSLNNYSAGDYDVTEKGFFIPVQIWIFNLSFGYRKVTYELGKGYPKLGDGTLYAGSGITPDTSIGGSDNFIDHQNRYVYTDVYEEAIPSTEEEFITDYESEREKVNFSFASYDNYSVNATGISGVMQPKIFENATLYGLGYAGTDTDDANRNMRVYYHNEGTSSKTFGTSSQNGSSDIEFYFNGQFTENLSIDTRNVSLNTADGLEDYLSGFDENITRQRSGNFVEVFTNQQLASGNHTGIMMPENPASGTIPLDGIGAYKITAPDGKTYHYSLPVYHYEQVERNLIKDNSEENVNEKRMYSPYATHWLLTAITGPDFIDVDNDNLPDEGDYGYWVRMDHGKWSDGFVWRSPYFGKKYNTNLAGEIETKDFGNYQYGRKQLYYLDKIVTRNHTAYFVKDLRYDGTGAHGTNSYNTNIQETYEYNFLGPQDLTDAVNGGTTRVGESIVYKREYQLMLDKIVVVENNGSPLSKNVNASSSLDNTSCFPGYVGNAMCDPDYGSQGGFEDVYGINYSYAIHQESQVYDVTDFENFDYSNTRKVIDLTYSYELARNTPSSLYCDGYGGGRLTLTGLDFRGKGDVRYMPPYRFAYKNEMEYPSGLNFNKVYQSDYLTGQAKDGWGFIDETQVTEKIYNSTVPEDYLKYGPDNWSLSEITTPTGGKIKLEYEEDDYEQEAFSRKLWQDNLQFLFNQRSTTTIPYTWNYLDIYVKNVDDLRPELIVDFNDYFDVGDIIYFDIWIARRVDAGFAYSDEQGGLNLPGNYSEDVVVSEIRSDGTMVLTVKRDRNAQSIFPCPPSNIDSDCSSYPVASFATSDEFITDTRYFDKGGAGSTEYLDGTRGSWVINNITNNESRHTMSYRLLANKVPKDIQGGGLRAKSITVSDENGREYKTNYYYNQPGTDRDKDDPNYVSSGVTSFAPENGIKFIPYQSELPSPGVMYEYVTMVPESTNGNELGSTRYRFHTLDPVFDLFDPEIKMEYMSEKIDDTTGQPVDELLTIFESKVTDHGAGDYFDSTNKTYAKTVDLKVNTALVGQFRSIEVFNKEEHLLSKTQKFYNDSYEGVNQNAEVIPGRGTIKESFQTMKSVFTTDANDDFPVLKNRYLSVSSKEDFTTVLQQVRTTTGGHTALEKYEDGDNQSGAFRTTTMTKADGTEVRSRQVPAYLRYPDMGSKVDDIDNKHMLTQNVMTISDVKVNGSWQTTAASVSTWSDQFVYDDGDINNPLTDNGIWRKHQSFVWKDDVATDGTFGQLVDSGDFNWTYNGSQSNTQWQKISETTRYDHWSSPLEIKDINDNYLSTKMGDKSKKIYATGNAGYNELFYSGAEDLEGNTFGGHVGIGTAVEEPNLANVHTGTKSLKIDANQTGYVVSVTEGKRDEYKVSLWTKYVGHTNVSLDVGGTPVDDRIEELVRSGDWVQLNFYFTVDGIKSVSVKATGGSAYVDDFRLHPVASTMTSYVYNDFDELTHILGGNNMATRYEYDEAGRLFKTFTEVEDFTTAGSGGFKRVNETLYTYKY